MIVSTRDTSWTLQEEQHTEKVDAAKLFSNQVEVEVAVGKVDAIAQYTAMGAVKHAEKRRNPKRVPNEMTEYWQCNVIDMLQKCTNNSHIEMVKPVGKG